MKQCLVNLCSPRYKFPQFIWSSLFTFSLLDRIYRILSIKYDGPSSFQFSRRCKSHRALIPHLLSKEQGEHWLCSDLRTLQDSSLPCTGYLILQPPSQPHPAFVGSNQLCDFWFNRTSLPCIESLQNMAGISVSQTDFS